jgi:hypothetical protein
MHIEFFAVGMLATLATAGVAVEKRASGCQAPPVAIQEAAQDACSVISPSELSLCIGDIITCCQDEPSFDVDQCVNAIVCID